MSVSTASGIMLKRTVLSSRLAAQPLYAMEVSTRSIRPATLGSYRAIHHSARLPAITPSETRHRPALRPHHHPAAPSPISKRTIFIQTENTPNPDVSFGHLIPFDMDHGENCLLTWIDCFVLGVEIHSQLPCPSGGFPDYLHRVPVSAVDSCTSPPIPPGRQLVKLRRRLIRLLRGRLYHSDQGERCQLGAHQTGSVQSDHSVRDIWRADCEHGRKDCWRARCPGGWQRGNIDIQ